MRWKQFTDNAIPFLETILKFLLIKRTKEVFRVISNFHQDKVSFEQRLVSKKIYDVMWEDIGRV